MRTLQHSRRPISAVAALVLLLGALGAPVARAQEDPCAPLAADPQYGLAGNPAVRTVTAVSATTGGVGYCLVEVNWSTPGMSGPAAGYAVGESQSINIRIGLPDPAAWTGRLIMTAGGGSQGTMPAVTGLVQMGAVGAGTDSGHGPGSNFGVIQETNTLNLGKIADWIGRSNGIAVRLAKDVSARWYGSAVTYTYWTGFSGGGHMGWTQVQQYAGEYDGALIGAPANHWQRFRLADSWDEIVRKKVAQQTAPITQAQMAAANSAAVAACDGLDGVIDGILADPRACTWSATHNICGAPGAPAAPACLDEIQADGIDRIWDGPRNSLGKRIWHPYDRGISLGTGTNTQGSTNQVMQWNRADLTFPPNNLYEDQESIDLAAAAGTDVSRAVTYEEEAALTSATTAALTDAADADLTEAHETGTKIILYHGNQDSAIHFRNAVDHYRRVATFFGDGVADFASLQDWFRFYIVPGMGHSGQGQLISNLIAWVEEGDAPDRLVRPSGFPVLCPFPQQAIHDGVGAASDPDSYTCGGDLDANPVALCQMPRTAFGLEDTAAMNFAEIGVAENVCRMVDIRSALDDLAAAGGITPSLEGKIRHALEMYELWIRNPRQFGPALSHLDRAVRLLLWQADVIDRGKPNQGDAPALRALADAIRALEQDVRGGGDPGL